MGQLVFAAKVTHIPRMVLSEGPGPLHDCRDDAIQGLQQIGERLVHWNSGRPVAGSSSARCCPAMPAPAPARAGCTTL